MKHVDVRELIAGAVLMSFGLFVALYAAGHYPVGQAARMGPGFFPVALGWILAAPAAPPERSSCWPACTDMEELAEPD